MNIFVAGASGAIGRQLLAALVRQGHAVTGMTNSDAGARVIAGFGAAGAQVSAFDAQVLEQSLACLFVLGLATDAHAVEPLLSHPEGRIRKTARTCLSEIRRRVAD